MKKLILIILLFVQGMAIAQLPTSTPRAIHRGGMQMLYGGDTLDMYFSNDTAFFYNRTGIFQFNGKIVSDSASLDTLTNDLVVLGTIVGMKDNATSFRVKGKSYYGNWVQSYMGVFNQNGYSDNGLLKTRTILGGNDSTDMEIQSSNVLLLTAVTNGNPTIGHINLSSTDSVVFNTRTISDLNSSKWLIIDRVDKTVNGSGNTSNVEISSSSGELRINGVDVLDSVLTNINSITSKKVVASDSLCLGAFRFIINLDTLCSITGTDTLRIHPTR